MSSIDYNGKIMQDDQPLFLAANKSYRYGDGLFETMKVSHGKILLEDLHFARLFSSLELLQLRLPAFFNREKIVGAILRLCELNKASNLARVRLSFFRGNGGLLEGTDEAKYLLEVWPLEPSVHEWSINGLELGIYPDARKSCDLFSPLKTSSFLPYVQAARYARANKWNDCLVLNTWGRICDSTIANVFLVKNGQLFTPPLDEGCIDGVMRRFLKTYLADNDLVLEEKGITISDLEEADEVFLTNCIRGIRWVGRIGDEKYSYQISRQLHEAVRRLLFKE
ncbi:MAG: aminotransferase class IV [Chitinophagaceae bacterium]